MHPARAALLHLSIAMFGTVVGYGVGHDSWHMIIAGSVGAASLLTYVCIDLLRRPVTS
jgi:hypothetical protein